MHRGNISPVGAPFSGVGRILCLDSWECLHLLGPA